MRNLEMKIPFLRKRSDWIYFEKEEKTLQIICPVLTDETFTVILRSKKMDLHTADYVNFEQRVKAYYIMIEHCHSFCIERSGRGFKSSVVAIINNL